MKTHLAFLLLFAFACPFVRAQSLPLNDGEVWENIYLEKNITKRLLVRLNEEGRVVNNATNPNFAYLDIGLNYKLNKHIHLSLAYVLTEKQQKTETFTTRHQAYGTITLRKKLFQFMFNNRSMIQWQVQDVYSSATGKFPEYYFRNKVSITYEKQFRFQPYVAEEVYCYLNQPYVHWQYKFNRVRYFAGIYYHPNMINEFEIYYLFENNFNQVNISPNKVAINPQNNYILGLGYAHTF